jgi:hypothetical protein
VQQGESTAGLFRSTGVVPTFIEEDAEVRQSSETLGLFEAEVE